MGRSLSSVKAASAFISNRVSAGAQSGAGVRLLLKKDRSEEPTKISWVPDPVTGYYRPENKPDEIDAAEMRRILIKNKTRRH